MLMFKEFRKLLENAHGESQHIIAIVTDIRGFTPFCSTRDNLEVATYIKRIYSKVIDDYFSSVSFCKPTGDGLLLVLPCELDSVKEISNNTIESCLNLSENFCDLCKDDPLINFETPRNIGIGLSRGTACRISSEGRILDYSGKVLNLASRLMDVARPSGIVFDSGFGFKLLSEENKAFFANEPIYIRGVAEEEPITVYYTKKRTIIPNFHKTPIKEPKWETYSEEAKFEELKQIEASGASGYFLTLPKKPLDKSKMTVAVSHPTIQGYRNETTLDLAAKGVSYYERGKTYRVFLDMKMLMGLLAKSGGAKEGTDIMFEVDYVIK
jgi:class 3 adenylate cyclase